MKINNLLKVIIGILFTVLAFFAREKYDDFNKAVLMTTSDHTELKVLAEKVNGIDQKVDLVLDKLDKIGESK